MKAPLPACVVCGAPTTRPRKVAWDVPLCVCSRCHSAFVWPRPEAGALRARYEEEHLAGKWAGYFEREPEEVWRRRVTLLGRLAPGRERVLDVGCGAGQFARAVGEDGWSAMGMEVSLQPLIEAHRRAPGALFAVAEMGALRAGPDFDAVTFWDVLEHVTDPLALLIEARRRLRPRGVVAATMPNVYGTTAWLHGPNWKYYDIAEFGHLFHLSRRGLGTLFKRAGLQVTWAKTVGSTDLRDVPEIRGHRPPGAFERWILDRMSGLLGLVAPRVGFGNTLVVVGRLP